MKTSKTNQGENYLINNSKTGFDIVPRSLINFIQDPSKAEARKLLGYQARKQPTYGSGITKVQKEEPLSKVQPAQTVIKTELT
jgi:hypothetical protein